MMVLRISEIWCSSAHSTPENRCLAWAPFWNNYKFTSSSLPAHALFSTKRILENGFNARLAKLTQIFRPSSPNFYRGEKVRKFTK